jgi:hypothetical protein
MSNIVWFYTYPEGRFANAAFQFVYAKYLEKLGYKVILGNKDHPRPYNLPWELFDINDNHISYSSEYEVFLGEERDFGPSISIEIIKSHFDRYPNSVLCVKGYFQFDTNRIKADHNYFKSFEEALSLTSQPTNTFQKILKKYYDKLRCNYLITIHIRRGDYTIYTGLGGWEEEVFYSLDLDNIIEKLNVYVITNRIHNFNLYIATDDINFCKSYFSNAKIRIITSHDFIDDGDENHLTVDLAAMAAANMLIASNSSLSILGAMINNCGRVFWRQDKNGNLISFDPWSTPVLYGPVLNNFRLK